MTKAVAIARPLVEALSMHPFAGHIFGVFKRACNLIDNDGRVVVLTSPEMGRGPFSIVVERSESLFKALKLKQSVFITSHFITIDRRKIDLTEAEVWEPRIIWPTEPLALNQAIFEILQPYTHWPQPEPDSAVAGQMVSRLRQAADQLLQALSRSENMEAAVTQLVGLGAGLTPAGDDYLVGVMAALWLNGSSDRLSNVIEAALSRTTNLSAAFLAAAARGEFMEPWHRLAQALSNDDDAAIQTAVNRIAQFGASSGKDALAGFAAALYHSLNNSPTEMPR